ncbi:cytochrome c [Thiofaba sp. EF100]|uniref:c-type cytochrome n=1 Tax=Thiofaba sp. EF100 TaxID=3121274 RepID=UPI0032214128
MRHALIPMLPAAFVATALFAEPVLADISRGQKLHEEKCAGCHKAPHNAAFYTSRVGKKYPTKDSLKTMVQSCVTYFDVPWFEEEVQAVTDYLNHTYYKYR